jgi:F420-0:gamma-glutamyl ligase
MDDDVLTTDQRRRIDRRTRWERRFQSVMITLCAAGVAVMGEGSESTPLVVIRGANVTFGNRKQKDSLIVEPADDIFAPLFFTGRRWKKGAQE